MIQWQAMLTAEVVEGHLLSCWRYGSGPLILCFQALPTSVATTLATCPFFLLSLGRGVIAFMPYPSHHPLLSYVLCAFTSSPNCAPRHSARTHHDLLSSLIGSIATQCLAFLFTGILIFVLLLLIPLSLGYFFNTSWIRPFLWIPAESTSMMGIFFLLKPTSFESLPYAIRILSTILFFLIADLYFKLLVFAGSGCRSDEGMGMAQTFAKFFTVCGEKFGVYFMDFARLVLRLEHILLDCAGGLGHVLCFELEPEDEIDLESQIYPTIV